MIAVTAATGEYGSLVVDRLLDRVPAAEIVVAVRNPVKAGNCAARGVEVRQADYDDPESLRRAFDGADRLLFISSPTFDSNQRMPQHLNVIAAAEAAKVGIVAYTSAGGADVSAEGGLADHHATEQALKASDVAYVMLRHPFYSEFFIHPGLQSAIDTGELTSSTAGRGLNTATRSDLAEAAAVILSSDGHANRAYELTGRVWTYPQLADVLSEMSGRTITYRETDSDEGMMQMIGPVVRAGRLERHAEDLERILGRPATSLHDAVAAVLPSIRTEAARSRITDPDIGSDRRAMTPETRRS